MLDDRLFAVWTPRLLSVLRIMAGLVILQFGTVKILGFPSAPGVPVMDYLSSVEPFTLTWFAGLIELIGGALLVLGLFTRTAAFVLSGEMAFAYFMAHAPASFFPIINTGNEAVLFCFVFLYLAAAGAGPWSIDAMRRRT